MPKRPAESLGNPFEPEQKRDSDQKDFIAKVLGTAHQQKRAKNKHPADDWGESTDIDFDPEWRIKELMKREANALRAFFGKEIVIPRLPEWVTPELMQYWEQIGCDLHYLPRINLADPEFDSEGELSRVCLKDFPGWKRRPDYSQFSKNPDFVQRLMRVKSGWRIIERRNFEIVRGDPLGPVLKLLRRQKQIDSGSSEQTRFGIMPRRFHYQTVREAFGKYLQVRHWIEERLPFHMEWAILANMFYPEWGIPNRADELFEETFTINNMEVQLTGGFSPSPSLVDDVSFSRGFRLASTLHE